MRPGLVALRAAGPAAVLALASAADAAYADDPAAGAGARITATVTPAAATPGGDVDVRVEGCDGAAGTVRSAAFVADAELSGRTGEGGPLHGDTTVKSGLASGTYQVTVVCGGRDHHDAGHVQVSPTAPPSPHAPVRAGGGGAAPLAAEAPSVAEQGPGTRHTVIGLVLAAVAAVAVALRSTRRRRGPGTD
ncbi:hypothetical protein [Streptomyces sp. TRM49041]|uniref:hypothetical protein n=1 Tax=Streptomyces sp. TRM49041 TaxID=2603216 RepID=UPI0011EECFC1|nr:hypothetical protein [Streptomyces sp. TRM49041]